MRKYIYVIIALLAIYVVGHGRSNGDNPSAIRDDRAEASAPEQSVARVGLQVGHWKNSELPDELYEKLQYSLGGEVAGVTEWELCLEIAQQTKALLEEDGYAVDLIPATVPEGYKADAFVALHTDGNDDTSVRGFKSIGSAWDESGQSDILSLAIDNALSVNTGMPSASYISEEMNEYYAFNFTKYDHAVSSTTPAVIVELGFLTNAQDRRFLKTDGELVAKSLRQAINTFLNGSS